MGWSVAKQEYDKAIADFNEAIRLDPEIRQRLQMPRPRLAEEAGVRQGHRRFHRGHPNRPEIRPRLLRPRPRLARQAGVRQGHRRFQRGHPTRPREYDAPTTTAATPGRASRSTTRPSPISTRPSESTRATPTPTTAVPGSGRRAPMRNTATESGPSNRRPGRANSRNGKSRTT